MAGNEQCWLGLVRPRTMHPRSIGRLVAYASRVLLPGDRYPTLPVLVDWGRLRPHDEYQPWTALTARQILDPYPVASEHEARAP